MKSPRDDNIKWHPKTLYKTLLHLFGREHPPCTPPLTAREFDIAKKLYIAGRVNHFVSNCQKTAAINHAAVNFKNRWPNLKSKDRNDWKAEKAIGTLFFSESRRGQAAARIVAKNLAEYGPKRHRTALKSARKATPQAKASFSVREVMLKAGPHLAELEFVWGFLRGEATALTGHVERESRSKAAADLARYYPFLNLTTAQIAVGLRNKNHIEETFAKDFGISKSSVRSIFF